MTTTLSPSAYGYRTDPWPENGPLFTVSPGRERCMRKQVSLCLNPRDDDRTRQAQVASGDMVTSTCSTRDPLRKACDCCSPVYTGGYSNPFPAYSPFTPDNAFFFRQDFPAFSFLPKCANLPPKTWTPPVF